MRSRLIALALLAACAGAVSLAPAADEPKGKEKEKDKGKPNKLDIGSHWRPYVGLSKGPLSIRGMMDLEAQTSNIEAVMSDKRPVFLGIQALTTLHVGYTDANDALPRSIKEVKYTNAYYGGSFDLGWKFLTAGIYVLKNDFATAWTAGWRVSVTQKF